MKLPTSPQEKIIIALDVSSIGEALRILDAFETPPSLCKIGLELFTAEGPAVVKAVKERGSSVFLDLKFHDIPNTVARAVASARDLGVAMTTLHASGGPAMLEAAVKAVGESDLLLLAVTVLTSMDASQLSATGISVNPETHVLRLSSIAREAGIGGIVCSPLEISSIRRIHGNHIRVVTPGVRPTWSDKGDQKRVMTPAEAIRAGADWLVLGRPITAANDPKQAFDKIISEVVD